MTIVELSRRSGVPVATIKFYVRSGILPPGDPVAANRTEYRQDHLTRLDLIRAFRDLGRFRLETARRVIELLGTGGPVDRRLVIALDELSLVPGEDDRPPFAPPEAARAQAEVAGLLAQFGWDDADDPPAAGADLATAIVLLRRLVDPELGIEALVPFGQAIAGLPLVDPPVERDPARDFIRFLLVEAIVVALYRLAGRARLNARPAEDR